MLGALWRSSNQSHFIGILDRETGKFRNVPVSNASDAKDRITRFSGPATDLYFTCAEYETPVNRTAANASGACAFWLDIDCGDEKAKAGKGYLTTEEAETGVREFCNKTGMPTQTDTVQSGSGLHAYWVLDECVPGAQWKASADKLKALTKHIGLLADDSRTSDIASVLRVPGTLNYKYSPPKPVAHHQQKDSHISTAVMLGAIDTAYLGISGEPVISPTIATRSKTRDRKKSMAYLILSA